MLQYNALLARAVPQWRGNTGDEDIERRSTSDGMKSSFEQDVLSIPRRSAAAPRGAMFCWM